MHLPVCARSPVCSRRPMLIRLVRWLLPWITALHCALFHLTGGLVGARLPGLRFLILEHVGRRTGTARETPLLYLEHGDAFIVVGSNAGEDRDPAWWLNLQATPDAHVRIGAVPVAVTARRAVGDEAERLWPVVYAGFRWFERYRAGTQRDIPIVILEPRAD